MFHLFQPAAKTSLQKNPPKKKSLDETIDECLSIGVAQPVMDLIENAELQKKSFFIEEAIKRFAAKNSYMLAKNIAHTQKYQEYVPDIFLILIRQFAITNERPQINEMLCQENDNEKRIKLMVSAVEGYLKKGYYNEAIEFLQQEEKEETLIRVCRRSLYAIMRTNNTDFLKRLYALIENKNQLFLLHSSLIYEAAFHNVVSVYDSLLESYADQPDQRFQLIKEALSGFLRGSHDSAAVNLFAKYKDISLSNNEDVLHEYIKVFFNNVREVNYHYAPALLSFAKPENRLKCYQSAVYLVPQRDGKILLNRLWKANHLLEQSKGFDAKQINVLKLSMAEGIVASSYLSNSDKLKAFNEMDKGDSALGIWRKVIGWSVDRELFDFIKLIPDIDKGPLFEKLMSKLSDRAIVKKMDQQTLLVFIAKLETLNLPKLSEEVIKRTQIIEAIDILDFLQRASKIGKIMREFSIKFDRAVSVLNDSLDDVGKIMKLFSCNFEQAYAARDMNLNKIQEIMSEFKWDIEKASSACQIWSLPLNVRWFLNANVPFPRKLRIEKLAEWLNVSPEQASVLYEANEKNKIFLNGMHCSLFKAALDDPSSPVYKAAEKAKLIKVQEIQGAEELIFHPSP